MKYSTVKAYVDALNAYKTAERAFYDASDVLNAASDALKAEVGELKIQHAVIVGGYVVLLHPRDPAAVVPLLDVE